ncbi:MAG: hypothetical protein ACR2PR_01275 [Pseudohongiellaceae bacterium]
MRGLAEFVMTGRKQAVIAVLLLGLVPLVNLLNPVVVGLVMLRKGAKEGASVLLWALLPVGGWALLGELVPLVMLFAVAGLALLLRETGAWQLTLLAAVTVGVGMDLYLRLQPALIDFMMAQLQVYLDAGGQNIVLPRESVLGATAALYIALAVALLMLARWMQAALYNPGGFREEFHRLRLTHRSVLALLAIMLPAFFGVVIPQTWVWYLAMPLMFAGIALVHGLMAMNKWPALWLVPFYGMMLLVPQLLIPQLVAMAAVVDSWYDFRSRLRNRSE